MAAERDLEGLGGWLILVGLGILIAPLRILVHVVPVYSGLLSDGTLAAITTPGTDSYDLLWAPILYGEIAINGGLVLTWVFIAFLFFTKKETFPRWYIGTMLFTLAFILVDALAIRLVLPEEKVFDAETATEFGRTLIATLIWVPYMLNSKRVRATFIQ